MGLFPGLRNDGRGSNPFSPRRGRRPGSRDRRTTPGLERLEGRTVLSQIGLTVSSLADSGPGTLRAAIVSADAGSHADKFTIGFSVTGTIDLQSPLPDLNNTIAIQGPGADSLTVERAAGASLFPSAIATVDAGQTVRLSGLTIANGDAPSIFGNDGGGIDNEGTLTLSGCTISGNSGAHFGGIFNGGTLTVSASTVSGNSSTGFGGGIVNAGTLTVSGSTLSGNSSSFEGGGIANLEGTLTISGCTLSGNSSPFGGGIVNESTLTVSNNSILSGNSSIVSGRSSTGSGGGIANQGTLTVSGSTLSGNSATYGGGIYNESNATLKVMNKSILSGNGAIDGGGIDNLGTATLQDSTLSGNSAGSEGGGILNDTFAILVTDDSVVYDNIAPLGADLYNLGSATIHDSTVDQIGP